MRIFFTAVLITCSMSSCIAQKNTVTFINQSNLNIDSLQIILSSANAYIIKHAEINIGDTLINVIPSDKPMSNNHDITVSISIYLKNHKVIHDYTYDDLGGSLITDYVISLNNDNKLVWEAKTSKKNQ
jgi:hypothetical protein